MPRTCGGYSEEAGEPGSLRPQDRDPGSISVVEVLSKRTLPSSRLRAPLLVRERPFDVWQLRWWPERAPRPRRRCRGEAGRRLASAAWLSSCQNLRVLQCERHCAIALSVLDRYEANLQGDGMADAVRFADRVRVGRCRGPPLFLQGIVRHYGFADCRRRATGSGREGRCGCVLVNGSAR